MKLLPALVIANTLQWSFGKLVSSSIFVIEHMICSNIYRTHDVFIFDEHMICSLYYYHLSNHCNIYPLIFSCNRGVSNNVRLVRSKSITPTHRQVAVAVESHLLLIMIVMWVFYLSRNIKRMLLDVFRNVIQII